MSDEVVLEQHAQRLEYRNGATMIDDQLYGLLEEIEDNSDEDLKYVAKNLRYYARKVDEMAEDS